MAEQAQQYYSLSKILEANAHYNVIFGQRSNGKTYAALEYGLKKYVKSGYVSQLAVIRRWQEDIIRPRAQNFFSGLVANGRVAELTGGEWTHVVFAAKQFFLAKRDKKLDKFITAKTPFGYAFSLSDMEHDKSTSYPQVSTIIFDEFIARHNYIQDEFPLFVNVLSTIIRNRTDVKIFLLGNTVNRYCPYFSEMGLDKVSEQPQGTIDVYNFANIQGHGTLKIAVEYAAAIESKQNSSVYFAFSNSSATQMIINGAWEIALYPHLSHDMHYTKRDVLFSYFIEWDGEYLQGDVVSKGDNFFTFIHRKTTPLQNPESDLIYSLTHNERYNIKRRLISKASKLQARVTWFFENDKVFYQDNELGEVVRNYVMRSGGDYKRL